MLERMDAFFDARLKTENVPAGRRVPVRGDPGQLGGHLYPESREKMLMQCAW